MVNEDAREFLKSSKFQTELLIQLLEVVDEETYDKAMANALDEFEGKE